MDTRRAEFAMRSFTESVVSNDDANESGENATFHAAPSRKSMDALGSAGCNEHVCSANNNASCLTHSSISFSSTSSSTDTTVRAAASAVVSKKASSASAATAAAAEEADDEEAVNNIERRRRLSAASLTTASSGSTGGVETIDEAEEGDGGDDDEPQQRQEQSQKLTRVESDDSPSSSRHRPLSFPASTSQCSPRNDDVSGAVVVDDRIEEAAADPRCLGPTQKYVVQVLGAGQYEQEIEQHEGLLTSAWTPDHGATSLIEEVDEASFNNSSRPTSATDRPRFESSNSSSGSNADFGEEQFCVDTHGRRGDEWSGGSGGEKSGQKKTLLERRRGRFTVSKKNTEEHIMERLETTNETTNNAIEHVNGGGEGGGGGGTMSAPLPTQTYSHRHSPKLTAALNKYAPAAVAMVARPRPRTPSSASLICAGIGHVAEELAQQQHTPPPSYASSAFARKCGRRLPSAPPDAFVPWLEKTAAAAAAAAAVPTTQEHTKMHIFLPPLQRLRDGAKRRNTLNIGEAAPSSAALASGTRGPPVFLRLRCDSLQAPFYASPAMNSPPPKPARTLLSSASGGAGSATPSEDDEQQTASGVVDATTSRDRREEQKFFGDWERFETPPTHDVEAAATTTNAAASASSPPHTSTSVFAPARGVGGATRTRRGTDDDVRTVVVVVPSLEMIAKRKSMSAFTQFNAASNESSNQQQQHERIKHHPHTTRTNNGGSKQRRSTWANISLAKVLKATTPTTTITTTKLADHHEAAGGALGEDVETIHALKGEAKTTSTMKTLSRDEAEEGEADMSCLRASDDVRRFSISLQTALLIEQRQKGDEEGSGGGGDEEGRVEAPEDDEETSLGAPPHLESTRQVTSEVVDPRDRITATPPSTPQRKRSGAEEGAHVCASLAAPRPIRAAPPPPVARRESATASSSLIAAEAHQQWAAQQHPASHDFQPQSSDYANASVYQPSPLVYDASEQIATIHNPFADDPSYGYDQPGDTGYCSAAPGGGVAPYYTNIGATSVGGWPAAAAAGGGGADTYYNAQLAQHAYYHSTSSNAADYGAYYTPSAAATAVGTFDVAAGYGTRRHDSITQQQQQQPALVGNYHQHQGYDQPNYYSYYGAYGGGSGASSDAYDPQQQQQPQTASAYYPHTAYGGDAVSNNQWAQHQQQPHHPPSSASFDHGGGGYGGAAGGGGGVYASATAQQSHPPPNEYYAAATYMTGGGGSWAGNEGYSATTTTTTNNPFVAEGVPAADAYYYAHQQQTPFSATEATPPPAIDNAMLYRGYGGAYAGYDYEQQQQQQPVNGDGATTAYGGGNDNAFGGAIGAGYNAYSAPDFEQQQRYYATHDAGLAVGIEGDENGANMTTQTFTSAEGGWTAPAQTAPAHSALSAKHEEFATTTTTADEEVVRTNGFSDAACTHAVDDEDVDADYYARMYGTPVVVQPPPPPPQTQPSPSRPPPPLVPPMFAASAVAAAAADPFSWEAQEQQQLAAAAAVAQTRFAAPPRPAVSPGATAAARPPPPPVPASPMLDQRRQQQQIPAPSFAGRRADTPIVDSGPDTPTSAEETVAPRQTSAAERRVSGGADVATANEKEEENDDAWSRFQKMSEKVASAMRTTSEQLKSFGSERGGSAVDALPAEQGHFAELGLSGGQTAFQLTATQRQTVVEHETEERRVRKEEKKKQKLFAISHKPTKGKKAKEALISDPALGADLERQAIELARRIAHERAADLGEPPATYVLPSAAADGAEADGEKQKDRKTNEQKAATKVTETTPENFADFKKAEAEGVIVHQKSPTTTRKQSTAPAAATTHHHASSSSPSAEQWPATTSGGGGGGGVATTTVEQQESQNESEASRVDWNAKFEGAQLLPPSESELSLVSKLKKVGSGSKKKAATKKQSGSSPENAGAEPAALAAGGETLEDEEDADEDEATTLALAPAVDPFAPVSADDEAAGMDEEGDREGVDFDPFEIRPVEEIIAETRQRYADERARVEAEAGQSGVADFFREKLARLSSSPTDHHHAGTKTAVGFEDDFKPETSAEDEVLFDEDDSLPLPAFPGAPAWTDVGWELLVRHPPKKKLMADRTWKPVFVLLVPETGTLCVCPNRAELNRPMQEIHLQQPGLQLSEVALQPFDVSQKLHTLKLQHVAYKERIGIRPGQISRLMEGHVTKYGMPLEHAAQCQVLVKFGCLNADTMAAFVRAVEDALFGAPRPKSAAAGSQQPVVLYKQDEVQLHCHDEYEARVDREGRVLDQRARVRLFCLAFLSGGATLEIGLNDRRREGKEIVHRKDILPMYTERWIRFEATEFHAVVESQGWADEQVVRVRPPDASPIELMRFRVRPPRNRERPLLVRCVIRIATDPAEVEIVVDAIAGANQQRARGTLDSTRAVPCEAVQVHVPVPRAWAYIFREERHWGVSSVHSRTRKPGKAKTIRDRLIGAVQHQPETLIEVGSGEAKYEQLFNALVWRIPRLGDRQDKLYKPYQLRCRFRLGSIDRIPEELTPDAHVEFTMPLCTVSNTVVRSVSIEGHDDSDRVERYVRYEARYRYEIAIDYVRCATLGDVAVAADSGAVEASGIPPASAVGGGEKVSNADHRLSSGEQRLHPSSIMLPPVAVVPAEGYRIQIEPATASSSPVLGNSSRDAFPLPPENGVPPTAAGGDGRGGAGEDGNFWATGAQQQQQASYGRQRPRSPSSSSNSSSGAEGGAERGGMRAGGVPMVNIDMKGYGY